MKRSYYCPFALMPMLLLAVLPSARGASIPLPEWKHLSSRHGDLPEPNGGTQQTASVLFDVDGNGTDDVVIAERTKAPSIIWIGWTENGWKKFMIDNTRQTPEAGGASHDLDGDGDLDLIIGGDSQSDELWWYENPKPHFDATTPWAKRLIKKGGGKAHHDQSIADFKGNGRPQLMFWNQGARKLFMAEIPKNLKQAEAWPIHEILDTSGFETANKQEGTAIFDIDQDGKVDLLAGIYWFKHLEGNRFKAIQICDHPGRIEAGFFKKSKYPQIVLGPGDGSGPLYFIECQGGDPSDPKAWKKRDLLGRTVVHGHSLQVADINQDGHLDILAAEMAKWTRGEGPDHPTATAWILFGNGQGEFKTTVFTTGFGFHDVRLGDVNKDGRLDIVSKPYTWDAPRLDIWLNQGNPPGAKSFGGKIEYPAAK